MSSFQDSSPRAEQKDNKQDKQEAPKDTTAAGDSVRSGADVAGDYIGNKGIGNAGMVAGKIVGAPFRGLGVLFGEIGGGVVGAFDEKAGESVKNGIKTAGEFTGKVFEVPTEFVVNLPAKPTGAVVDGLISGGGKVVGGLVDRGANALNADSAEKQQAKNRDAAIGAAVAARLAKAEEETRAKKESTITESHTYDTAPAWERGMFRRDGNVSGTGIALINAVVPDKKLRITGKDVSSRDIEKAVKAIQDTSQTIAATGVVDERTFKLMQERLDKLESAKSRPRANKADENKKAEPKAATPDTDKATAPASAKPAKAAEPQAGAEAPPPVAAANKGQAPAAPVVAPTEPPSPKVTNSPVPTPTPTIGATEIATSTPTETPTVVPTDTPTPEPTATPALPPLAGVETFEDLQPHLDRLANKFGFGNIGFWDGDWHAPQEVAANLAKLEQAFEGVQSEVVTFPRDQVDIRLNPTNLRAKLTYREGLQSTSEDGRRPTLAIDYTESVGEIKKDMLEALMPFEERAKGGKALGELVDELDGRVRGIGFDNKLPFNYDTLVTNLPQIKEAILLTEQASPEYAEALKKEGVAINLTGQYSGLNGLNQSKNYAELNWSYRGNAEGMASDLQKGLDQFLENKREFFAAVQPIRDQEQIPISRWLGSRHDISALKNQVPRVLEALGLLADDKRALLKEKTVEIVFPNGVSQPRGYIRDNLIEVSYRGSPQKITDGINEAIEQWRGAQK